MKKNILLVLITTIICVGITAFAYNYNADDIAYKNASVKDALDDLYTEKSFSGVSFLGKTTAIGNTTTTYTFDKDVDLGLVIVSASNDTTNTSYFYANIQSLTTGNYRQLDTATNSFSEGGIPAGHRSTVYIIEGVKKDSVLTAAIRYAGIIQVFEIN